MGSWVSDSVVLFLVFLFLSSGMLAPAFVFYSRSMDFWSIRSEFKNGFD